MIIINFNFLIMTEQERIENLEREVRELKAANWQMKVGARAEKMGIPESRIREGFAISSTATDAELDEHLKKVAAHFRKEELQVSDGDLKTAASNMVR
jgi:hypothetical protein